MYRIVAGLLLLSLIPSRSLAATIVMGGGAEGFVSMAYARELERVAEKLDPTLDVEIRVTGGSFDNLKRLGGGGIDVGLVAVNGLRGDLPDARLSLLWVEAPFPMLMFMRSDLGISRIADIRSVRVIPGGSGSAPDRLAPSLYGRLGARPTWIRAGIDQIGYMIRTRQADGFVGSQRVFDVVMKEYGMPDVGPVGLTPDDAREIEAADRDLAALAETHGGRPVLGWGMKFGMVARGDLPSRAAEVLTDAARRIASRGSSREHILDWTTDGTLDRIKVPLHDGSAAVLKRAGTRP